MFVFRMAALAAMALFSFTLAQNSTATCANNTITLLPPSARSQIKCETSFASGSDSNVTSVIATLRMPRAAFCQQKNEWGSKCSTLRKEGDAAIGLCGNRDDMSCWHLALYADWIQQACSSNGRTGGQYQIDWGMRLIVFNSKDSLLTAEEAGTEDLVAAIEAYEALQD